MINIRKIDLPEKCRIICVSDIHAHYDEFARLLRKCGYDKESDYLFILGDILERQTEYRNTALYTGIVPWRKMRMHQR